MNLYITYSLAPTDGHIASLLARQAQTRGIAVETSKHPALPVSAGVASLGLLNANFVVAIVSKDSPNLTNVQHEIVIAKNLGKPVLALVEEGVALLPSGIAPGVYIPFNRGEIQPALNTINKILEEKKQTENAKNWLVAGGVALLALYLFNRE